MRTAVIVVGGLGLAYLGAEIAVLTRRQWNDPGPLSRTIRALSLLAVGLCIAGMVAIWLHAADRPL